MAAIIKSDGTVVASNIELADTVLKQTVGVMLRRQLPQGFAMIFDMGREMRAELTIHMMFVFVPIDVVFLDRNRRIVDLKRHLRPWIGLAYPKERAQYAIEMPAGAADAIGLQVGETLQW